MPASKIDEKKNQPLTDSLNHRYLFFTFTDLDRYLLTEPMDFFEPYYSAARLLYHPSKSTHRIMNRNLSTYKRRLNRQNNIYRSSLINDTVYTHCPSMFLDNFLANH